MSASLVGRFARASLVGVVAVLWCMGLARAEDKPTTTPSTAPTTAPAPLKIPSAPKKGKGMITGVIKHANGTIASELKLRLVQDDPISMGGGGGRGGEKLIQKCTTDMEGKYVFVDLKPGSFRIIGGNNDIGWIYYDLDVPADEVTSLDIPLTKLGGGGDPAGGDK